MKDPCDDPNDSDEKTNPNSRCEYNEEQASEDRSTTDERPLVSTSTQRH